MRIVSNKSVLVIIKINNRDEENPRPTEYYSLKINTVPNKSLIAPYIVFLSHVIP